MKLDLLPEDCISHILSFLSPQDVCRSSLVSGDVRSVADSDALWELLLPSDYKQLLSRMVSHISWSSKKELFLALCSPLLIDGGTKAISIEKSTRKICYMLSARDITITWASNPLYWRWKPFHNSRFAEVAELRTIWWLEIQAKISTEMLSPNTNYAAYLLVLFENRAYGLDTLPSEASIQMGGYQSQMNVYLQPPCKGQEKQSPCGLLPSSQIKGERRSLKEREDGWTEIELGEFYIGERSGDNAEARISLREVKGVHLKGGLIVEGIEVRPKL